MVTQIKGSTVINDSSELEVDIIRYGVLIIGETGGSNAGFVSGGYNGSTPVSTINRWPFASDTSTSSAGNLSSSSTDLAGQSSSTSGYNSGVSGTSVEKFSFATSVTSASIGTLFSARNRAAGQSSSNHGYTSGGMTPPTASTNTIDKFPFATNANASSVGTLSQGRERVAGHQSLDYGYTSGGWDTGIAGTASRIDKFPFASDTNATTVGSLLVRVPGSPDNYSTGRQYVSGQSSAVAGYISGGFASTTLVNTLDKFSFASDSNTTFVFDLNSIIARTAGVSSTTNGYVAGGANGPSTGNHTANVMKYPFSSETSSSTVSTLTQSRYGPAGQQD